MLSAIVIGTSMVIGGSIILFSCDLKNIRIKVVVFLNHFYHTVATIADCSMLKNSLLFYTHEVKFKNQRI